jgi:HAD superfamily hydrolase (TIGR01509 family)
MQDKRSAKAPSTSRIKGLLLDLDDTLVPTGQFYEPAMTVAGVDPQSFRLGRTVTKDRLGNGHVSARNRLLYLKARAEAASGFQSSDVLATMTRYEDALVAMCRDAWRSLGRGALISALAARYKIALVTNENVRTQLLKIAAFAPDDRFFSVVVTSEEMGFEKPDLRIFREAASRLALDPRECVMVGDDVESDMIPSRELGMRAIWSTEFLDPSSIAAGDRRWDGPKVKSLTELVGALGALDE